MQEEKDTIHGNYFGGGRAGYHAWNFTAPVFVQEPFKIYFYLQTYSQPVSDSVSSQLDYNSNVLISSQKNMYFHLFSHFTGVSHQSFYNNNNNYRLIKNPKNTAHCDTILNSNYIYFHKITKSMSIIYQTLYFQVFVLYHYSCNQCLLQKLLQYKHCTYIYRVRDTPTSELSLPFVVMQAVFQQRRSASYFAGASELVFTDLFCQKCPTLLPKR